MPTAPQVAEILVGEVVNIAADFRGFLDEGETISGTPTVEELATSLLSITGAQANVAPLVINGATVPAGLAVQCQVDAANAVADRYDLRITAETSAGQRRKGVVRINVCE